MKEKCLVEINDDELVLIDDIQNHLQDLCNILKLIENEEQWRRVRDYINSKDYIDLPYSSPFITKAK